MTRRWHQGRRRQAGRPPPHLQEPPLRALDNTAGGDHMIDQPHAPRRPRGQRRAFKNHLQRPRHPDQPRQPRRATPRGHQPELRFRQTDFRRRMIARKTEVTGQREFVTPAKTSAVDGRDLGQRQRGKLSKDTLPQFQNLAQLVRARLRQRIQIGPCNEDRRLGAPHQHATHPRRAFRFREPADMPLQFPQGRVIEDISRRPRRVENQMAHPVAIDLAASGLRHHRRGHRLGGGFWKKHRVHNMS